MTAMKRDRSLLETARALAAATPAGDTPLRDRLVPRLEARLVNATWTLRRLPDREAGFRKMKGCLWPEMQAESTSYAPASQTSFQARRSVRLTAREIDEMQPALDLLLLLPDLVDRRILFWAAWHQDGETLDRVPWAKVRRSLGLSLSRWTLKRRYENSLLWLAGLISLQAPAV